MDLKGKIISAAPVFAALVAMACEGDIPSQPNGDGGMPAPVETPAVAVSRANCPGFQFHADYERCMILQTFVESRLGPYDVYLKVEGGEGTYPKEIPQSGGGWKHVLVYRAGKKITFTMTLHYEGAPSAEGFCSITDGGELVKNKLKSITAGGGSPYEAVCVLTTSQV